MAGKASQNSSAETAKLRPAAKFNRRGLDNRCSRYAASFSTWAISDGMPECQRNGACWLGGRQT